MAKIHNLKQNVQMQVLNVYSKKDLFLSHPDLNPHFEIHTQSPLEDNILVDQKLTIYSRLSVNKIRITNKYKDK